MQSDDDFNILDVSPFGHCGTKFPRYATDDDITNKGSFGQYPGQRGVFVNSDPVMADILKRNSGFIHLLGAAEQSM
jgi:hypothetical protein